MNVSYVINAATSISALIITLLITITCALSTDLRQPVHKWFFITVLLNLVIIAAEFAVEFLSAGSSKLITAVLNVIDLLSYAVGGAQIFTFGMYLYHYFKKRTQFSKVFIYVIAAICAAAILLAAAARFTGLYAYFDSVNNYHKQPTFWISQVFPALGIMVFAAATVKNIKKVSAKEGASLLLYCVVPLICYIIEIVYADIWISHFGTALTLFMVYVNIQLELKHSLQLKEAELLESQISVMLSQIQPHFLYNALTAIDDLIITRPADARKAIMDFSSYLRKNMDSLSQKELIPFEQELEHTAQYLRLEKLRFGDRLDIDYSIGTKDFKLPVLTLQPIVENAVRYGVTKRRDGGTVSISTLETSGNFLIVVRDNGAGFDTGSIPNDGRSHLGIANVTSRLKAMCGGEIRIGSTAGEGTEVIILIPKAKP